MQITLPQTPETHFKLYYYAAALDLIARISRMFGSREQVNSFLGFARSEA